MPSILVYGDGVTLGPGESPALLNVEGLRELDLVGIMWEARTGMRPSASRVSSPCEGGETIERGVEDAQGSPPGVVRRRSVACQATLPAAGQGQGCTCTRAGAQAQALRSGGGGGGGSPFEEVLARVGAARRLPDVATLRPRPAVVAPCQPRPLRPAGVAAPLGAELATASTTASQPGWGSPSPPGTPPGATPVPIVRLDSLLSLDGSWGIGTPGDGVAWTFLPSSMLPGPAPLPDFPPSAGDVAEAAASRPGPAADASAPAAAPAVPESLQRSMQVQSRHLLHMFSRLQRNHLARVPGGGAPSSGARPARPGGRALKGFWRQMHASPAAAERAAPAPAPAPAPALGHGNRPRLASPATWPPPDAHTLAQRADVVVVPGYPAPATSEPWEAPPSRGIVAAGCGTLPRSP